MGNVNHKSKRTAGVLAILLGGFGAHKFYLGYIKEGLILLAVSLLGSIIGLALLGFIASVIGIIEGIIYLKKSDQVFNAIYVANQKKWF